MGRETAYYIAMAFIILAIGRCWGPPPERPEHYEPTPYSERDRG